VRVI